MNVTDIVILIALALGAIGGFKSGVIKKTANFVGIFIIIILSFYLKNYLSVFTDEVVCPCCGKTELKNGKSQTLLCRDCYKKMRSKDRHHHQSDKKESAPPPKRQKNNWKFLKYGVKWAYFGVLHHQSVYPLMDKRIIKKINKSWISKQNSSAIRRQ